MKKIIVLIILSVGSAFAQDFNLIAAYPHVSHPEPSVASLMRFEEIPVSNYTGIPEISIPIFSLPTRSKDLVMNLSLGYHPSSVAVNEPIGECGLGWSLFSGGIISRTIYNKPDELALSHNLNESNDIYQFNFMGHFGRFYVNKDAVSNSLNVKILENTNSKLVITLDYNATTFIINSFTVYDDKGYKYYFEDFDTQSYIPVSTPTYSYKGAFHLTQIFDNNDQELIKFNYNSYSEIVTPTYSNNYKKTKEVIVDGYGKVAYTYSNGISTLYSNSIRLSQLELKDNASNTIKKLKFIYLNSGNSLYKLEKTNADESIKEKHEFSYKGVSAVYGGTIEEDEWGYRTYLPTCVYSYPIVNVTTNISSMYRTEGVLEKIKVPTGGSIFFDYEPNSYSYYNRDAAGAWHLNDDPAYYYDDTKPENYIVSTFAYNEFTGTGNNTFTFTTPGTGTVAQPYYFNVEASAYSSATIDSSVFIGFNDPNEVFYPTLILNGQGVSNKYLTDSNSSSNLCLGELIMLLPGKTYTITINAMGNNNKKAKIHITTKAQNANINKNFYGGGIRIKQIAYFDQDLNSYYDDVNYYNSQNIFPVKERKYDYNFFDQPNRSSGAIVYPCFDPTTNSRVKREPVGYKNVTVSENGIGKTQFTYNSPMDFDYTYNDNGLKVIYYDYKRGLLTNKKIRDNNDVLLSEAILSYDYVETPNSTIFFDNPALNERLGWSKLKSKVTKNYFSVAPTVPKEITENFIYNDDNRKIIEHTISNSLLGQTLKTEYTYHTGNSPFSQNRISELETSKKYRGTELLETSKINYSNTWVGNQSYLPQTVQAAKGILTLENTLKYNMYDEYSNPVEVQQESGTPTVFIWGYNKTQLIAKIENSAYASIPTNLITAAQTASDTGTEAQLLTALTNLRNATQLANSLITTYTYKPLIGLSTVTDAKNNINYYNYDSFGRLLNVTDRDSNILSENKYNIKP